MLCNAWTRFKAFTISCLGKSLFLYVWLVLSASSTQLLSFHYWFCEKFRSGNDLFHWSFAYSRHVCHVELCRHFNQKQQQGMFSEDNHRAFGDIHEKSYRFRQASKACGIPTWWRKRLWNKLHATVQKNQEYIHFSRLGRGSFYI